MVRSKEAWSDASHCLFFDVSQTAALPCADALVHGGNKALKFSHQLHQLSPTVLFYRRPLQLKVPSECSRLLNLWKPPGDWKAFKVMWKWSDLLVVILKVEKFNNEIQAVVWFPRRISWFTFIKSIIATIHHTWCLQKNKTKNKTNQKTPKRRKNIYMVCL